jgi:hypothetical protein
MEDMKMSAAFKSLNFTTINVKPATVDPVMVRRNNTIKRLEEQARLIADPSHLRVLHTRTGDKSQKIIPWFQAQGDGTYAFFVKCGWQTVKFDKNSNAVTVPSRDKLQSVIATLIAAVKAGELDNQLASASAQVSAKLKRKPSPAKTK